MKPLETFIKNSASAMIVAFSLAVIASAQTAGPKVVYTRDKAPLPVAGYNTLYCAGYIQSSAIATSNYIIGAVTESDGFLSSQAQVLYINMGSNKGVNEGDVLSIVRPRGRVESRWTRKNVGFYVQEVGAVEVIRVKADYSVVRVKTSCDNLLQGDLVQLAEKRNSPLAVERPALDLFGDPSGKAMGRILMGRDGADLLYRDAIAYVDIGAEENVKVGDRITIFRPLGTGNLYRAPEKESVSARDEGFQSKEYRGGKFSNQAGRKSGDKADGKVVRTFDAREGRPAIRQVVGEAMVVNVKERAATIVITRNAQEIHPGDWVELQ